MLSPGEKLVLALEELRWRLNDSGVERTVGLVNNLGKDCKYYKISLSRFISKDYTDIKNQINRINELIGVIENE